MKILANIFYLYLMVIFKYIFIFWRNCVKLRKKPVKGLPYMKKVICLVIVIFMFVFAVSCGKTGDDATTAGSVVSSDKTYASTFDTSANTNRTTSVTKNTSASTTSPTVSEPIGKNDPVNEKVGSYVTVVYNPAYCTITSEVKKGVGSKEEVTLSINLRDGYIFDGWSVNNAISNGAEVAGKSKSYKLTVNEETTIWANYSVNIVYNPNGGKVVSGGNTYTQKFSVTWYKCPNTLPEQGYFVRDGYTLVEYNTKADGSGMSISLGSRVPMYDKPQAELYCIWAKQSDVSDFKFSSPKNGEVEITDYNGKDDVVVIPETYNGNKVVSISSNAFISAKMHTVILSKNITGVARSAFSYCSNLKTFVMFDSLSYIEDASFVETEVENLRVNAVYNLYNDWMVNQSNNKMDRLLYAASMGLKKIVIYGGSGALNGFDCEAIDEAFGGEYYVINLGSNANVTALVFFEYLEKVLSKDDIVLWAPEAGYSIYGDTYFSAPRAWEFNAGYYDIFRNVKLSDFENVFSGFSYYSMLHAEKQKSFDIFDRNFNRYGDYIQVRVSELKDYNYGGSYNSILRAMEGNRFSVMSGVIDDMTEKGIKVYFTYPAMDEEGSGLSDELMAEVEMAIKKTFPTLTVISNYKDCLVKHDQMHNSEWHCTLEGAAARTKIVIRDIKAQLEKEG